MGGGNYRNGKNGSNLTKEEMRRKHQHEESDAYLFDVEYDKLKKEEERLEKEYQREREEYRRITEDLRREMMNGTASEADMARFMSALTDRGVQLQQQQEKMQQSIDSLNEQRNEVARDMNDLRRRAFSGSTNAPAVDRTRDYEGFKNGTSARYANAKVVEMSPEEYLRRVALGFNNQTVTSMLNQSNPSAIARYMRNMLRGTKYNAPTLNYGSNSSAGDERAIAALMNGYKRIPVMVIE